MNIKTVTFTGADKTTTPEEMLLVNKDYPDFNVEWGILLSKNSSNSSRFPSMQWIADLCDKAQNGTKLAGHIQGQWLRGMAEGNFTFAEQYPAIWNRLDRIQLNFHSNPSYCTDEMYLKFQEHKKQYIVQMDGINDNIFVKGLLLSHLDPLGAVLFDIVPLFDKSAGAGIVPDQWPRPMPVKLNGYAGGLGPHNILDELSRIEDVALGENIWVDCETKIRDQDDNFSLDLCRQMLDEIRVFRECVRR